MSRSCQLTPNKATKGNRIAVSRNQISKRVPTMRRYNSQTMSLIICNAKQLEKSLKELKAHVSFTSATSHVRAANSIGRNKVQLIRSKLQLAQESDNPVKISLKISTSALRTIEKKGGLLPYLIHSKRGHLSSFGNRFRDEVARAYGIKYLSHREQKT